MCDDCIAGGAAAHAHVGYAAPPPPLSWHVCYEVVKRGHLQCMPAAMQAMHDDAAVSATQKQQIMHNIVLHGTFEMLQAAHACGGPLHYNTLTLASYANRADMLNFLLDRGVAVAREAIVNAIEAGSLDSLLALDARGLLDAAAYETAKCLSAMYGYASMLRWVHEQHGVVLSHADLERTRSGFEPPRRRVPSEMHAVVAYLAEHGIA